MTVNRLIHEKSPYLLQHAHNPVDWYRWSEEAFARAAAENKPIFLSIGYATCHWCHVMERESFEDPETARILNETFVCIKVDREERPDVDAVYMTACQMISGHGGWPLSIFMTSDRKPFFAATYLPRRSRFGRLGVIELCGQIRQLWNSNQPSILTSAEDIARHLARAFEFSPSRDRLDLSILDKALAAIRKSFDATHGGFDSAPKFPTPHRLQFLLRQYHRTRDETVLAMVSDTLLAMRRGGIWDHVGFGFHRYSTDPRWLVPHFEKMLYDQALLAAAYLEAYQVTGDRLFAKTAREIFTYVERDMTDPAGGFYTAEDADSEGVEGKYYVWTRAEFQKALGNKDAVPWQDVFNVQVQGNFLEESTGHKIQANILHLTRPPAKWAEAWQIDEETWEKRWETVRRALFESRKMRPAPLKDDKILTDINGLMIAAMAMGARILGEMRYETAARKAVDFIFKNLIAADGRLLHRFRQEDAAIPAHAADYAYLSMGLLELYHTTFQVEYLERAMALMDRMMIDFWDEKQGGFYLNARDSENLPVRPKEVYDGAIPSANSVAATNLIRLARLTGRSDLEETAQHLIQAFSAHIQAQPTAFTHFLMAIGYALGQSCEVVLVGDPDRSDIQQMLSSLNTSFAPGTSVMLKTDQNQGRLASLSQFTQNLTQTGKSATAYVCAGLHCTQPFTDSAPMLRLILEKTRSGSKFTTP
jgi:uncharacterized protein YyaL (SSP411 family)